MKLLLVSPNKKQSQSINVGLTMEILAFKLKKQKEVKLDYQKSLGRLF